MGPFSFGGTRWLLARLFSAIHLYPWFQLVFPWRHRHYVVAEGGVIRGSFISVILAGAPLTSRKLHSSRRKSHPPQRRIPYSGGWLCHAMDITFYRAAGHPPQSYIPQSSSCFCGLQEITSLRTTLGRSKSKCVALSEMLTIRWDVNGIHLCTNRNLIGREGSD
jgi:hypothetical protein